MKLNETDALLKRIKRVHFIGIGGISMSALAEILKKEGYEVTGSDINEGESVRRLKAAGITVYIGHQASNLADAELVVFTNAVKPDNPEMQEAFARNIPLVNRAELLGSIMKRYRYPIAVAGMHGKTTTTAMISHLLLQAGLDPTILVGGYMPQIGSNFKVGSGPYIVCEACEYMDSFLSFFPKISVILNIEEEHLDYFRDFDHILDSFKKFAHLNGEDGTVIANADDANVMEAVKDYKGRVITYGLKSQSADVRADNLTFSESGMPHFDIIENGTSIIHIELSIPGRHNVQNALAAFAVARAVHLPLKVIQDGLNSFSSASRRFEYKGGFDGVTVVDDYAHHPTEIEATLSTAKNMGYKRVICVFQPHTYTRTLALLDGFAKALSLADKVILAPIYEAREKDIYGVSSADLAHRIRDSVYLHDFGIIEAYIRDIAEEGDLVITMGAGDIYKVANHLCGEC